MVIPARPATAHEVRQVGDLEMVVGWAEEPAYAGFRNAVSLFISEGKEPVEDAELQVAVLFGGEEAELSTEPMPLEAAFGEPGAYEAFIIPTRPGTYTFHFTGTAGGQTIDEVFTSGPEFDDVHNPADVQFPERDPTAAEITDRLERIDARLAEIDSGSSTLPVILSVVALLVGAAALALALRRRRG